MAISKRLRFELFKRDGFTCQYCGQRAPDVILEVDHIVALSNGGSDDPENLTTSCKDCNRGKCASVIDYAGSLIDRIMGDPRDMFEVAVTLFDTLSLGMFSNGFSLEPEDFARIERLRFRFAELQEQKSREGDAFYQNWRARRKAEKEQGLLQ
jgi:hypothetical protein